MGRFSQCLLTCMDVPSLSFRFDVESDLSITRSITISSKWNEAGFSVDQAAAEEPLEISLAGKIGYLVSGDTLLNGANEFLDMAQNRLSIVQGSPIGGLIAPQAKAVIGAINKAQTTVRAADNFLTKIKKEIKGNDRLDEMNATLSHICASKMLVKIDTPLDTIENMIIANLAVNYEDKADQSLGISLSLKEVRFVKLKTANLDEALFATNMCRADIGLSGSVDNGQAAVANKIPKSRNTSSWDAGARSIGEAVRL